MKSLAAKLKDQYGQQVTYIHCLAHCTELIINDPISHSQMLQTAFSTLKYLQCSLATSGSSFVSSVHRGGVRNALTAINEGLLYTLFLDMYPKRVKL